jgi:hypothetical protein
MAALHSYVFALFKNYPLHYTTILATDFRQSLSLFQKHALSAQTLFAMEQASEKAVSPVFPLNLRLPGKQRLSPQNFSFETASIINCNRIFGDNEYMYDNRRLEKYIGV